MKHPTTHSGKSSNLIREKEKKLEHSHQTKGATSHVGHKLTEEDRKKSGSHSK